MRQLFYLVSLSVLTILISCKSRQNAANVTTSSASGTGRYDAYRNKLPDTKVEQIDKTLRVTFDSEILFPSNSSYLTDKAKEDIKDLVDMIKQQGTVQIVIEGHSDKTGTPEYNKWLSEKRAVSVKAAAVGFGLSESSIKTVGYGDTKPIADNKTPEGRAKNRRVVVIITPAS